MESINSRKLNLIYLIARFAPWQGGAERYLLELAKRAQAAGHQVTVLTGDAAPTGGHLPAREMVEGVEVIRSHAWNRQLNLGFAPGMLIELNRLIEESPDLPAVVHYGNGPGFIWQEWCLLYSKLKNRDLKVLASPHGPFLSTPGTHANWKSILVWPAKFIGRIYFRLLWPRIIDHLLADNNKQPQWMNDLYGFTDSQISLIPICISEKIIENSKPEISPDMPVVITGLNRMERYKGFQDIVTAMGIAKEKFNFPVKLTLMGKPGNASDLIQELIGKYDLQNQVEVLISPDDDTRDDILLNKSQIHILPSQFEATGIVLLEAMAKGNVIVTTTGNEAHDILITQGENGYVYDFGDTEKLAEILVNLVNDPQLRQKMIENNLLKVKQFTWEGVAEKYLEVLGALRGTE